MALRQYDINQLQAVICLVMKEPRRRLTIAEMAQEAAMSVTKFKKQFRQLYKAAPFIYITQLKLERAKQMLEETEYAVRYIALQAGYHHSTNFTKAFKKQFGTTPNRFRQTLQTKLTFEM